MILVGDARERLRDLPAGSVQCVVLDPFIGSGTVAVVAERPGRSWMGIDLSEGYAKQAWTRIKLARRGLRVRRDASHNAVALRQPLLVGAE